MKTVILHQLNIIRTREQKKLLDMALDILRTNKSFENKKSSLSLVNDLTMLSALTDHVLNDEKSLANYNKLANLLPRLMNKNKRINAQLNSILHDLNLLKEIQERNTDDIPAANPGDTSVGNSFEQIYTGLNASIQAIGTDLKELAGKINSSLPELPDSRPLAPFCFINKDVRVTEGMVSMIVLNENGAEHLKNLFESFIKFNSYKNYEFILADRASTDNSLEIARSYQGKLPVVILPFDQKFTNAYLFNHAVDLCRSEYILFLNNRSVFTTDNLPLFHDNLRKHKSNGIVGASISTPGTPANSEKDELYGSIKFTIDEITGPPDIPFPVIDPGFLALSGIETSIRNYRKEERVFIPPGSILPCIKPIPVSHVKMDGAKTVPALSGTAMFCRRLDFMRVDGFDLNYIDGYEDIDLCLKFALQLDKKTLLAHDILLQITNDDKIAEPGSPEEITRNYNLGTFLNRFGYYVKHKYFIGLAEKKQLWTTDTAASIRKSKKLLGSLGQSPAEGPVDLKDAELVKKITTGYLNGIKDNKLRIAIKIPALNNDSAALWGDYHFAHSLKNAFIKKGHPARVDLFDFWHEQGYMTDDVVIVLRGIRRYHTRGSQINIMWNISHPEKIGLDEYQDYDHVFVASDSLANELKIQSGINAESLFQCTDPEIFYPDPTLPGDDVKTDILFVANSRGVMRKCIEFTMQKGIPVTIYGTNWENLLPPGMIKGNYIKNEELRKYYSNCNILLNDHWQDMVDSGLISNRIFDALACGAIVLTDRVNGIENTFREGLFYYRNADELAEQIKWIREHKQEAKQMALKNSKKVLANHTFDIRAERILKVAREIHRQKITASHGESTWNIKMFKRWF